jgi:hypothetical protein
VRVESPGGPLREGSITVTDNTHDAMLSRVQRLEEVSESPRVGRKSASGREHGARPSGRRADSTTAFSAPRASGMATTDPRWSLSNPGRPLSLREHETGSTSARARLYEDLLADARRYARRSS